jgi:hypothetical protein
VVSHRERPEKAAGSTCEALVLSFQFPHYRTDFTQACNLNRSQYLPLAVATRESSPSSMPPRQNPTINRAGTRMSQSASIKRRTTNFLTQAQKNASPAKPPEYQATYPVYACPWEKLKAWLERTFPDHTFDEWVCVPA